MGYCIIRVIIAAIYDPSLVGIVAILMELFNMISFSGPFNKALGSNYLRFKIEIKKCETTVP
jgi:hypothetical protein